MSVYKSEPGEIEHASHQEDACCESKPIKVEQMDINISDVRSINSAMWSSLPPGECCFYDIMLVSWLYDMTCKWLWSELPK